MDDVELVRRAKEYARVLTTKTANLREGITPFEGVVAAYLAGAREQAARDDPDFDATDAAHPAWWRGHWHGASAICRDVTAILDGKSDRGGVSNEPWETVRRRLLELVDAEKSRDRAAVERLRAAAKEILGWDGTENPHEFESYRNAVAELRAALAALPARPKSTKEE